MPYLTDEMKEKFNEALYNVMSILVGQLPDSCDDERMGAAGGMLNFIFNTLALSVLTNVPRETKYKHLERLLGTFEAAKLEFWRRVIVIYEEEARRRNGDIFTDGP